MIAKNPNACTFAQKNPKTSTPKPAIGHAASASGNREPGTKNSSPPTGNREPGTGNSSQPTEHRALGTSSTNPQSAIRNPQSSPHPNTAAPEKFDTNSSLFQKLTPDQRAQLDQAIVDRDPPTYAGLYEKFNLTDFNISFTAFYLYARRIRLHAARVGLARLVLPNDEQTASLVPELLRTRLLETLMDDEAPPRVIRALTEAWRMAASHTLAQSRAHANARQADIANLTKKHDDMLIMVQQMGRLIRELTDENTRLTARCAEVTKAERDANPP